MKVTALYSGASSYALVGPQGMIILLILGGKDVF